MITGFNTDVEYQGVTYHVQTEDKGVSTPMIMSLVYDRGTILASKRSPYDDLLKDTLDEKVLAERLQKQHHLICAAIVAGRLEDLKRMTMKDAEASKQKKLVVQREVRTAPAESVPKPVVPVENIPPAPPAETISALPAQPPPVDRGKSIADAIDIAKGNPIAPTPAPPPRLDGPVPKPTQELEWGFPVDLSEDDLIIEGVEVVEEEMILPAEAVAIVSEFSTSEHKAAGKLGIDLITENSFKGGERQTLGILIYRGVKEYPVNNAQIMVKVLGSSFRPLIFHAKTDEKGIATVHLQLPHFRSGRAALLVRAMNGGEEVEIRRRVSHG